MRYATFALFFLLAAGVLAPGAFAQAPTPGSCTLGTAEKDLDVNNILARAFMTGSIGYGNTTTNGDGYLAPQASGNSPIFASGIWIGGRVNGELRVAGSTYDRFEFWPGPINDDGTLPNPSNCRDYDRIWKVGRSDILNFESGSGASADLASWPAELGAPVIAAPDNGFDDDGDGLVDEGTDGIDNDGDGFIDERDEQERVDPAVRQAAGRPIYDLDGGDRPDIIGDQTIWWVMNDLGNTHAKSLTPPIGVEVQVQAWSFARADALNDVTFWRYRLIKKTPGNLEDTYLSIFSDPDLGGADDDYIGVDTTLSLGYVYNGADTDDAYGIPPAAGYDFFQGPIIDGDTLGVTRFMYFTNGAAAGQVDPGNGVGMYNFMQGLWGDGVPLTEGGDGYQTAGPVTLFAFPGDPVTGQFWSEGNVDGSGGTNQPGDRRFLVTTGPFTLEPGVTQDIVYGIVFAQGSDRLNSITALRAADLLAQNAYNIDFELPQAPPPPPLCDVNSPNQQLQPGSGTCFEAATVSGRAALVWGYPTNSPNYLGRYEVQNRLLAGQDVPDDTYSFEGFNIYRYPNANFNDDRRELVATFDIVNGVTTVIDTAFSAEVNGLVPFVAARGTDSGIQYSLDLTQFNLINYRDYYFGISAYAHNEFSTPKVIESAPTKITVRPANVAAGQGGSVQQVDLGSGLIGTRIGGRGIAGVQARVVDPTRITGATYTAEFFQVDPDTTASGDEFVTYRILRDGSVIFDGGAAYAETGQRVTFGEQTIILDGIEFFTATVLPQAIAEADIGNAASPRFAGGASAAGIVETAHPTQDPCGPGARLNGASGLAGDCAFPEFYPGNRVWLDPNSTGDYYVSMYNTSAPDQAPVLTGATGLGQFINAGVPDDFEIRFTEAGGLAVYAQPPNPNSGGLTIMQVPFELWNIREATNPDDDVRMIPIIRANTFGEEYAEWADNFTATQASTVGEGVVPVTEQIYWMMPDRPNGYELFEQAAVGFGGPGASYDPANDGDTQIDPNPASGANCSRQSYYIDFCYRGQGTFVAPISKMVFADLAGDGTTPPAGTTVRLITAPKPAIGAGDVVVFDTESIRFITNDADAAREALDLIGVVPNPYMGRSAYETNNLDRVVRFINLPDRVTIRIYTVAGTLIRTLQKDGPSRSLDWNLETENGLPVASGMYLIHVDAPNVGEKVIKFGVVNRRNRITVF